MGGHQRVQLPYPGSPIGDPPGGQHAAVLVQQAQVMVTLAPVGSKKQHDGLLCSDLLSLSQRRTCGALMAVLIWHDIPPAVRPPQHRAGTVSPTSSPGSEASECSPAGGSDRKVRHGHVTKMGSPWVRFVLQEAAQRAKTRPPFATFYAKTAARRGKHIATVAWRSPASSLLAVSCAHRAATHCRRRSTCRVRSPHHMCLNHGRRTD
jgi:hypothetical protein